jgi:dihydropteroate synthase
VEENYELLHRLDELTALFREPLLTALSRKSMIYKRLGTTPDEALTGTVALDAIALEKGSRLLRVHDPRPAAETIRLLFS